MHDILSRKEMCLQSCDHFKLWEVKISHER